MRQHHPTPSTHRTESRAQRHKRRGEPANEQMPCICRVPGPGRAQHRDSARFGHGLCAQPHHTHGAPRRYPAPRCPRVTSHRASLPVVRALGRARYPACVAPRDTDTARQPWLVSCPPWVCVACLCGGPLSPLASPHLVPWSLGRHSTRVRLHMSLDWPLLHLRCSFAGLTQLVE